jgi:Carbohydrate-binding family 9
MSGRQINPERCVNEPDAQAERVMPPAVGHTPVQYCYEIRHAGVMPDLQGLWDGPVWQAAPTLNVDQFHPRSSAHRPRTRAKLLYNQQVLRVLFDVQDRFVRCTHKGYQQPVCRDGCVEFFVAPQPGQGYLNFEINCGGAMLVYHIVDPARASGGGFMAYTVLPEKLLKQVAIYHSLPQHVEPEIAGPTNWRVELAISWCFFEATSRLVRPTAGSSWRGNFCKCADHTSHPHWASWSPIGEVLNFHNPAGFGTIHFARE